MIALPLDITVEEARAVALSLTEDDARQLWYDWPSWARGEQTMPQGDAWRTWLLLGGRGSGKTRPCAEAVRVWARDPNAVIALIGPTSADVRQVMIEGESGILNVCPPEERPRWQPSVRRLVFPSGASAFTYSAEEPERLRGPQHSHCWCDEIAAYPDPKAVWDLLLPGLRLGRNPQRIVSTTPKPLKFLHDLIADPGTVVGRMKTWDNRANLPPAYIDELKRIYGGTRIGRQELEGELLDEAEGALWKRSRIDDLRVRTAPELTRIVVAIDPAVTSGPDSDECGIIAAGIGTDGEGYVLADKTSRLPPDGWAHRAVSLFDQVEADRIIAEVNNGGDLVESVIRTVRRNIPYEKISASRGKVVRAEPVAALYEQGRVHHCGAFPELEDEMVNFVPGALSKSPNRADALVWAITWLMLKSRGQGRALWVG
jgi:phage terminase large subunit-like protein